MRWALPIGRVFGIGLRLHFTFLLLVGFIGYQGFLALGASGAGWAVALVLAVFACVVLHELGHSVVAQRLGVEVRSITLLPIGGVAALRSIPENPWHEMAITVAGPLMNLLIAGILLPVTGWPREFLWVHYPDNLMALLRTLVGVNLGLFVFNFIPAFPMDGGRMLRALLALWMSYRRATVVAATTGQMLAVLFIVAGLKFSVMWIMLGAFIFLAAEGEEKTVKMRSVLREVEVADVMTREVVTVTPQTPVRDVLAAMYRTGQDDFPVMDGDRLVGLVTRPTVIQTVNERGEHVAVAEIMDPDPPVLSPHNNVAWVHEQVMSEHYQGFPVLENGRLVGLLTPDNISRYLLLQESLKGWRPARATTPTPPRVSATAPPVANPPPPPKSAPPAVPS